MAEFGENVRRLREAKGLTQQSLADELYVTRQAVSRWEGGSRFPDLMTAKKLATALGSTMDALLSDEDMKQYAQKSPVLESPVSKGAQIAVFAFGFAGYLTRLLWFALNLMDVKGWGTSPVGIVEMIEIVLMAALFGFGTLAAIRDRLTPRVAAAIAAVYFGCAALVQALSGAFRVETVTLVIVEVLLGGCVAWYFLRDRLVKPWIVYGVCAAGCCARLVSAAYTLHVGSGLSSDMGSLVIISTLVHTLARLATLALLCVMARTLYRKRRRMAID